MADPSLFDFMRLPPPALIAMDNRALHFAMQPYHYLIRLSHVAAMGMFSGAIGLVDLRLMGWRNALPLRLYVSTVLPWLYATFAVTITTGAALFAYDPLRVGSHAYFAPKLALIALGLANALLFHYTSYRHLQTSDGRPSLGIRAAGAASFVVWIAVIVCSSMNVEGIPKVLLR
jgi:hypothetical protein